jgi:hypothetical protein
VLAAPTGAIALVVLAQKLLPPHRLIDVRSPSPSSHSP